MLTTNACRLLRLTVLTCRAPNYDVNEDVRLTVERSMRLVTRLRNILVVNDDRDLINYCLDPIIAITYDALMCLRSPRNLTGCVSVASRNRRLRITRHDRLLVRLDLNLPIRFVTFLLVRIRLCFMDGMNVRQIIVCAGLS